MTGPTILVVAKAPVPGRVKTRLTPALTSHQAAALASAALLDTVDVAEDAARACGGRVVVALSGEAGLAVAPAVLARRLSTVIVLPQRGCGLAARLVAAHVDASDGPCVQVGMDTPQVSTTTILDVVRAVSARHGPDVVLGPATDGGWWCLGVRRTADVRHLAGVAMSQSTTGQHTMAAFRQAGLDVELAPVLTDVDTVADIPAVVRSAPSTRFAQLARVLAPSSMAAMP